MKPQNRIIFIIIFTITIFHTNSGFFTIPLALGQQMQRDNYFLELDQTVSETPAISPFLKDPVEQQLPTPGDDESVSIASIYSYDTTHSFSFSLSDLQVDYGVLSPTNPITRTTNFVFYNTTIGGKILAWEDHPLRSENTIILPDTTCDNGQCNELRSSLWDNTLAFGFGFRCDIATSQYCSKDFAESLAFMQFPDISNKETAAVIASFSSSPNAKEGKITYKVNAAGSQPPGQYTNTVTFLAIPGI
jgi:hypothetical protein